MTEGIPKQPSPRLAAHASTANAAVVRVIRGAAWAIALLVIAKTKTDPDLWGHLRFGGDILRIGITETDPYSFTSDIPWINHEWLAEVLMHLAWTAGGTAGLIALKLVLLATTMLVVWSVIRQAALEPIVADVLLLLVLFGTWPRTSVVRPQLFSLLLFAVLLWILRSAAAGRSRRMFWLPLVFAAWVNLHGGWVVGFGMFALWLAITAVEGRDQRPWSVSLWLGLLTTAALSANPYGWRMLTFVGDTVRFDRVEITDWQPAWESWELLLLWSLSAATAAVVLLRRRAEVRRADLAIVIALGLASLKVVRIDAFFAIAVVMLLGPHIGYLHDPPRFWKPALWTRGAAALAVAVSLGIGWLTFSVRHQFSCLPMDVGWEPEREAGAFIGANHLTGRLLTWFDWGEYAIWHFGPALKVSMDGRRETVYSGGSLAEHFGLYHEPKAYFHVLERMSPDYAWLPRELALAGELQSRGWSPIFTGPKSVVLSTRAGSYASPLVSGPACFPGH
jgi:hypothetical protein